MLEASDDPLLKPRQVEAASYPSLHGRGVLITGGGSGIGMYLVEAFCAQGARVGFVDLNAEAGARVADVVAKTTGNRPAFRQCDLTDIAALRDAVEALRAQTGPITALVNNAGNDDRVPFEDLSPDYWDERQAVNMRHHVFAAQAVLPDMKAAGQGVILSMGSNSWMQGAPGLLAYTTAKSSVQGFVRCLAREVGAFGVRVNAIAPGWILTDRQVSRARAVLTHKFEEYLQKQCLKEFLLPPDVARMALFLCADDSRMITGQTMIVDGGVV
ncbi:putative L-arabinose 1-dehydrogenase [Candidatus Rhodobacter oscarellae]|uniref:Putative L-arabinose 1-dehydrogenase n=1 Tax=Candidatus Rhodobacter oscarellae TaxID=1675527 RepID=A0A0J9E6N9_9RHOB|nr:SDR family oxidoreductase [Candidatus Rhodobacter lobularis]KMW58326.1 putative L-arabinose 1-dehydrogenase [Candidatus Rhodobacter lobularis]